MAGAPAGPEHMQRYDSTNIFGIFKMDDGNLLDFDDLAGYLDEDVPDEIPLLDILQPPSQPMQMQMQFPPQVQPLQLPQQQGHTVTTTGPLGNTLKNEHGPAELEQGPLSTSGAAESAHTRAQNWGSSGSDSDQSAGDHTEQQRAGRRSRNSSRSGKAGEAGGKGGSSGVRKGRRQRNAEQMELNRVAQQKYRQRKKSEQNQLQSAVDMLTAQVAALKALEVRNSELAAHNASLQSSMQQQGSTIAALQSHAMAQAAELDATRNALAHSQAQVSQQQTVILDQETKLRLQEEVIASLKDRLKERIDEAMQHVVPGTVCEKMVAAVKATLYGAKDMQGLQDTLATLPEHLVTEICKAIWCVCKESFPELRQRCAQANCTTAGVQA